MPEADFEEQFDFIGFPRTFPFALDAKYTTGPFPTRSPYVSKISRSVATILVAADGSGDYEDIQKAIDALPSAGGIIYLKEGTYRPSATINLTKDNISIIGSGKATVIQPTSALASGNLLRALSKTGILISQIFINGTDAADLVGISIESSTDCSVEKVWAQNCGDNAINFGNTSTSSIIGCHLSLNNTAIIISGTASNNIITANTLDANTVVGLTIQNSANDNLVSSNQIVNHDDSGNIGLYITHSSCNNNLLANNIFRNNTTDITDNGTGTRIANFDLNGNFILTGRVIKPT